MSWDYDFDDDDYYGYSDDDYEESDGDCDAYDHDTFENYTQGRELLAALASQRETREFLDVVVQVEGREFPCHRAVLGSTRYFKTMLSSNLSESNSEVIRLCGIDSNSFSKILDFLYTGEIRIGKDDVLDILQTAHLFQLEKIVEYCREFIQDNLCQSNCLGVMRLADLYGFAALKKKARDMAVVNFPDVTQEEVFPILSAAALADLLGDEHLKVTNEDDVVNSVIRWLDENPGNDQKAILKILQEIRLSCVKVSMLQKLESHPVIQDFAECLAKITAAKEKHLFGTDVQGEDESSRRHGTPDNLAIMVGGWKAVKKQLNPLDEQFILSQPTPLQSIICFNPDSEQFYHIATIPTPAVSGYMSVASAGRHLYVTGGRAHPLLGQGPHSAPSRQAFRYDFPSDTWLRLPDMPRGRAGHQSVVVDGKLFVAGGDAGSFVTMDCYDPVEGAWIKLKIPVLPPLRTSSAFKVTAFRGKVVFIEVQKKGTDDRTIDVLFDAILRIYDQRNRNQGKLCVHSLDVKTNVWRHADTYAPRRSLMHVDILSTTVHDKLYIRTTCTAKYDDLYIFDAEEGTLIKGNGRDWKENVLRARSEHSYRYMNGQEGIVDTIHNYAYGDYGHISTRQTPLPFVLLGHSFLETKKSRLGWYCRDLAALGKDGKREPWSDGEPTGATSSE